MKPDPDRRLIFHIGHRKSGSTAIQDALARAEIRPDGRRVLYTSKLAHNYLIRQFIAWDADRSEQSDPAAWQGLIELSHRLARHDYDYAVFSGEDFEEVDPALMARVLKRFFLPHVQDCRVLCWVRPHASRLISDFTEQNKIGDFSGDLNNFHKHMLRVRRLLYSEQIARWQDCFGAGFRARIMQRDLLKGGSILEDFTTVAFDDDTKVEIASPRYSNKSLSVEDLAILRYLQKRLADKGRDLRHAFGWEMAHLLQSRPRKGTRLRLHRALAEQIRMDYLDDARALDRRAFAATPIFERELDRAVDEAPFQAQPLDPGDYLDEEEMRKLSLMADLALALLENKGQPWHPYLVGRHIKRVHQNISAPLTPEPGGQGQCRAESHATSGTG